MNALACFIKYPLPGIVKTRLAEEIGDDKAANLYKQWVEKLLAEHSDKSYDLIVYYTGATLEELHAWLGHQIFIEQIEGKLDAKLRFVFQKLCDEYDSVCVIGSDLPDISSSEVKNAFLTLEEKDIVIGPATDGGYYLIGMQKYIDVFVDIDWSTDVVFSQTVKQIEQLNLSFGTLPERRDIDTKEDLDAYADSAK